MGENKKVKIKIDKEKMEELIIDYMTSGVQDNDFKTEIIELVWDKYPRKLNRKKSEAIWKRIPKSDRLKILTDIESRFTNMDSQYIPYPSSYLNQERWNDEPENNSQDEQTKFAI